MEDVKYLFQIRAQNDQLLFNVPLTKEAVKQIRDKADEIYNKDLSDEEVGIIALNVELHAPSPQLGTEDPKTAYELLQGKTLEKKV